METDAFLTREAQHVTSLDSGAIDQADERLELARVIASYQPAAPHEHRRHEAKSLLVFDAVYVRLLSVADHHAIAISPSLAGQALLISSLNTLKIPRAGVMTPQFSFASPTEERAMRVLTETVQSGSTPLILQVAVPWDHNADVLERLDLLLVITLPTVLLVAAIGGWALVGRTLQPIHRIVSEAKKLDVNAPPKELLPAPTETDSEIGNLVATLNSMTTRLHEAFLAQRGFAEAQQRFAADSSHELRTPLTILRGEMELALTRPRSAEAYQATIASGIEEIIRMSRIVESLSFLARHDASQLQPSYSHRSIDLFDLVQKVAASFETRAHEKQINLRVGPDACTAPVWGDEVQLQQLLGNLVDNAVKYTGDGGSIEISVLAEGAGADRVCRVLVEDTGIGIEEKDLPHVFDRFWRADLARPSGGSGLGLAICAQIALLHRGEIRVKSQVGHGTTVELIMPSPAG